MVSIPQISRLNVLFLWLTQKTSSSFKIAISTVLKLADGRWYTKVMYVLDLTLLKHVRFDLILLHLGYSGRKSENVYFLIHKLPVEELGDWVWRIKKKKNHKHRWFTWIICVETRWAECGERFRNIFCIIWLSLELSEPFRVNWVLGCQNYLLELYVSFPE